MDIIFPENLPHPDGDIKYCILREGYEEQYGRTTSSGRVLYGVDWPRRHHFAAKVLGVPASPGDPWTPWVMTGLANVIAMDARAIGDGATQIDGVPFSVAKIEVQYGTPPYDIANEVLATIEIQGSSSIITQPAGTLFFDSDDKPYNVEGGLNLAEKVYALTRYRMSDMDAVEAEFDALIGKTNNATFRGKPAGHVYFKTYSTSSVHTAFGMPDITASCQLVYRTIGWNKAIRPGDGTIEGVHYDTGAKPYPEADFSGLM